MSLNPESELVPENELRAALRSYQVNAGNFAAGVQTRIQIGEVERANDPLANAPRLLRVAAALLPAPFVTGGKVAASAAPLTNTSVFSKILAYAALPAISVFVLLGAAIVGIVGVRRVQKGNILANLDQQALRQATALWWRRHRWPTLMVYAITFALAWVGATFLMLLLYLISLGFMLFMLSGLARLGLADRRSIAGLLIAGLCQLAQISYLGTIRQTHDIHFLDQSLLPAIFYCGVLALLPALFRGELASALQRRLRWLVVLVCVVANGVMIAWFSNSIWQPTTSEQIKSYVESFDHAPFKGASWRQWEIPAAWPSSQSWARIFLTHAGCLQPRSQGSKTDSRWVPRSESDW